MENFEFYNPTKLIFGKNTISKLGKEIKRYDYKKVLLIAGSGSIKKNSVYEQTTQSLKENNIEWVEVWGVRPNPLLSKVEEIIALAQKEKPDALLAVGGGSTIDTAKAVSAGFFLEDVWDAFENWSLIEKALPIFTVLTISATGSEMNMGSVITNEVENKKWALVNPLLYPKVSIIDPSVQETLPWNQTVNGAIDSLSHIMEFYFLGIDEETTLSLNEGLMKSVFTSTDLLQEENNYEARANIAWAATLALNGTSGCMIDKSGWSVHGIEHGLSAIFPNIAHAEGLGILFPAWINHVYKENEVTFKRWAKKIFNKDSVEEATQAWIEKLKVWKAPTKLSELNVKEEDLDKIADNVLMKGSFGGVKQLNKEDIMAILEAAL